MNYWLIALVSLLIGWSTVRLVLWLFPKIGLMDRPHKYGLKRAPIPYYGGWAIFIAFCVSVCLWLKLDSRLISLMAIGAGIVLISFWDDYKGIKPIWRLLMQLVVGVLIYWSGTFVTALPNPIGPEIVLTNFSWGGVMILSLLVTVIWFVLIMNTVNWIDGLNGLPSGVSAIAFATLFVLSIKPGIHSVDQTVVAVIGLSMALIMLVFCLHDFYPAKLLMGDTGSMFLGFLLAAMAIYSGGKLATAFLALGFPILDAVWVIFRRILNGTSPFKGDLMHFHHRLTYAGLSEKQALLVIYCCSAFFGLLAVILDHGQKIWAVIGAITVMTILGFVTVMLEVEKSRKKG